MDDEFVITVKGSKWGSKPVREVDVNISHLARETGYSRSHLSRVFSGEAFPSVHLLRSLAVKMRVSMDSLYNYLEGDEWAKGNRRGRS